MLEYKTVLLSFFGGILPALMWLDFWVRKDSHRAPRKLIIATFMLSMISVFLAGILEQVSSLFIQPYTYFSLFVWAFIEEAVKFAAVYAIALRSRFLTEPVDMIIYLITSALGFAAFENMIFLFEPISSGNILHSLGTLSFRFAGATLLHTISSGVIGLFLALSFYKSYGTKIFMGCFGFVLSVLLHTSFNRFIIIYEQKHLIFLFSAVWLGIITLLILIEKLKRTKKITSQ